MKFLSNQALHSNNSIKIEDYFDKKIIHALPPQHQQILNKLFASESSHLEKFFHKLSGNQIYLNHDMLLKILDKLCLQMTLPVHLIDQPKRIPIELELETPKTNPKINLWFELQDKLNIWSIHPAETIYQILARSHYYIETEQSPHFKEIEKQTQSHFFWKRKTKTAHLSFDIVFKFVFEKLKYFHWELLPQTKRPMDLFELFCPIEDAALEKRIIHLNEEQIGFFRSLNASALIYSAIYSFAPSMPELVADAIQNSPFQTNTSLYQSLLNHDQYEPIYGAHPHLQNFNKQSLLMGIRELFIHILHTKKISSKISNEYKINECLDYLLNPSSLPEIKQFFFNHSSRLIFIFNRLTSLGFLLRSPLLKGLGYHPLINTDVPIRIFNNLEIVIQILASSNHEDQHSFIKDIFNEQNLDYPQLSSIIK